METLTTRAARAEAEVNVGSIDGTAVLAGRIAGHRATTSTFYRRRGKRLLDLTLGTLLFVSLLPVMALAALAVLLSSGWPVLYRAERVGRDGRSFRMLKLRTMVNGAHDMLTDLLKTDAALAGEYGRSLKLRADPRRTRVGVILRRLSFDELPQLWHVITGQMSLVGPRPYAAEEMALLSGHPQILEATPALTGPWQVGGRDELPPQVRVALDAQYEAGITLAGDLRYLLATVRCVVRANGR